jgi:hypothetical protein
MSWSLGEAMQVLKPAPPLRDQGLALPSLLLRDLTLESARATPASAVLGKER